MPVTTTPVNLLQVSIALGRLQGIREEGVNAFHGVPYAQPPVGQLRFKRPRPLQPWNGTLDATKATAASLQTNAENQARVAAYAKQLDPGVPGIMGWPGYAGDTYGQPVVGEDCLYNDIWVPDSAENSNLPVYIYYHGGANAMSSGHMTLERGANLAREENVIVVRPTYRLGALGWVNFGLVSDELKEAVNLGVHDQIAALRWVYENIRAFGGDPNNITIGGESCGATATSHLLINAEARPMIRRAVLQSLSPFHNWCTQPRDLAITVAEQYLEILGIEDVKELMELDGEKLLAVQGIMTRLFEADKNCAWRPLGAAVDGETVPELPALRLSSPSFDGKGLEVLIGVAKDEWQFFRGHSHTAQHGTAEEVKSAFAEVFGNDGANLVYENYQALYPGREPGHTLGDVMSFEFFKFSSLAIAHNLAAQGVPVYMFQFSYDLPGYGGYLRAVHTGDTPFVFRNLSPADLKRWPGFDGTDPNELRRIAAEFGALYGSFLRTGDPGSQWPRFNSESQTILWFGTKVEAKPHLLSAELEIFAKAGIADVSTLEARLSRNVRSALNVPNRAFPPLPSSSKTGISHSEEDDIDSIRQLNEHWIDANNSRDVPRFMSFWAEGATFAAGEPAAWSATGVEQIEKLYHVLLERFPFFFTMCHSGLVKVEGDTARARWHMNEVAQGPDAKKGMINFGIYEDEWVRTDGGWKIKSRVFNYLYLDQAPLPGQWFALPPGFAAFHQ